MPDLKAPGIAIVIAVIGGLAILGGVYLCVETWPGDPGVGYTWKTEAYIPAFTWLFSALMSGVIFFAAAAALTYLHHTREYTKSILHYTREYRKPVLHEALHHQREQ